MPNFRSSRARVNSTCLHVPSVFVAKSGHEQKLFPGSLPRRDALVVYGGQGVRLALGIVPMLIVAGIIEAFLSPSFVPAPAKFVFAFAVFGLFALYVTQAGRTNNRK